MGGAYKSIFLLPKAAHRSLSDDGWEFLSDKKLPEEVVFLLVGKFHLSFKKNYLGITVYQGHGLQFSVIHDDLGQIEYVSIQIHSGSIDEVVKIIDEFNMEDVEIFIPLVMLDQSSGADPD